MTMIMPRRPAIPAACAFTSTPNRRYPSPNLERDPAGATAIVEDAAARRPLPQGCQELLVRGELMRETERCEVERTVVPGERYWGHDVRLKEQGAFPALTDFICGLAEPRPGSVARKCGGRRSLRGIRLTAASRACGDLPREVVSAQRSPPRRDVAHRPSSMTVRLKACQDGHAK